MPPLPSRAELLPGTLAMLVLKTLTVDTMHGYAIAQHIARASRNGIGVVRWMSREAPRNVRRGPEYSAPIGPNLV